jgi:hypothetical protein
VTRTPITFERRLQIAGILLISGLMVEAICLLWVRPLSFIALVCVGGSLSAAGIVLYLSSLVSAGNANPKNERIT